MAAFTREFTEDVWVTGFKVPNTTLKNIDAKTVQSWNGDGGGSYAPSAAVIIAGAGMMLCTWATLTGGGQVSTAAGSHITHGDSDYIVLGPGNSNATRVLVERICESVRQTVSPFAMAAANTNGAVQSRSQACRILTPIRTHHGATISQVVFDFFVTSTHASVPTYLPKFRVMRKSLVDGSYVPCRAIDAVTDPNGWVMFSPRPANPTAWLAGSAVQTFTYGVNQNNVADRAKYRFVAEIIEEYSPGFSSSTAHSGNVWLNTRTTNTLIPDLRPQ